MSPLRIRISLVLAALLLAAGLSFAGQSFLSEEPYYPNVQSAFTLGLAILFLVGGYVFIEAALFGSDEDLIKFSRPPAICLLTFKGNVDLVRFALFGSGIFLLVIGALGVSNFFK